MPLRRQSVLQEQMDLVVVAARQWRRAVKARIASDMQTYPVSSVEAPREHRELVAAIDQLEEMSAAIKRTSTGRSAAPDHGPKSKARSPSHR
jgi:hypothetical protein